MDDLKDWPAHVAELIAKLAADPEMKDGQKMLQASFDRVSNKIAGLEADVRVLLSKVQSLS